MEKLLKNFFLNKENNITYISENEKNTLKLGYEISKYLNKDNNILSLNGELGSGKTALTKGITNYFKVEDQVSSPTFTIVNEYIKDDLKIFHFDVYRIYDSLEFEDTIGLDYFNNGICIIEWGNIIKDILPSNTIYIDITKIDENKRNINIRRNV